MGHFNISAAASEYQHHPIDSIEVLYQDAYVAVLQTNAGIDLSNIDNLANTKATYGAFNLGLHVADNPARVLNNRAALLRYLNRFGQVCCIHWLTQVHGNRVVQVEQLPLGIKSVEADALISTQPQHALAIMTADCVPICLWQQNTHKIATIHAGWQGLVNGVIANTLAQFERQQGVIHAMIGACISQRCYEVSQQLVDKMALSLPFVGDMQPFVQAHSSESQKAWLDLPRIAVAQLQQAGVIREHINEGYRQNSIEADKKVSDVHWACSYQDTHYYSYRRMTHDKLTQTGRMAMVVVRRQ
ncbi:peptidoglycan editing factor PgeF [Psychrobacter sp. I-STPA10]|uniref:peptidoglycan editing factor PgeF n=1 Tax=Psychrobacter sp. I-STPA10 TaxID=2585769 RepID=UPI001E54FFB2|nr:peptidoglycan editing factor PgeF [Psychrobacter sp. I-STPA10]